jgi:hypothetical protein
MKVYVTLSYEGNDIVYSFRFVWVTHSKWMSLVMKNNITKKVRRNFINIPNAVFDTELDITNLFY